MGLFPFSFSNLATATKSYQKQLLPETTGRNQDLSSQQTIKYLRNILIIKLVIPYRQFFYTFEKDMRMGVVPAYMSVHQV